MIGPLVAAWRQAGDGHAAIVRSFAMAGSRVRFEIVGEALAAAITRAFVHLAIEPVDAPDLRVLLWDVAATGVGRPLPDLRLMMRDQSAFGDGVVARQADGLSGFQSPRIFAALDGAHGVLVGCVTDAAALSFFEIGKPLQPLLFQWHAAHGTLPLHGALVSADGRGMLFGGRGGSGKSTSALSCAHAGLDFLGDDYVGIASDAAGAPIGHSLYASAWLEDGHSERIGWLAGHRLPGTETGERKLSFSVIDALPGAMIRRTRIVAIALPRVTGQAVASARRIGPGEALRRLAPSSILQIPFLETPEAMAAIGRLVRSCPCYELAVGPDLPSIAACVRDLLREQPA